MRTFAEACNELAYHPATPETAPIFSQLRSYAMGFVGDTWGLVPDGPEKTLAYRGLQQWLMYANLAVALTAPADLLNPHVARVLP